MGILFPPLSRAEHVAAKGAPWLRRPVTDEINQGFGRAAPSAALAWSLNRLALICTSEKWVERGYDISGIVSRVWNVYL